MATDFLFDDTDMDMQIAFGDWVIGDSDDQHNEVVMVAAPGMVRCSPITGVALLRKTKSRLTLKDQDALKQEITLQLQVDGCSSTNVVINSNLDLTVQGTR
jgi:hypothetical protein